MNRSDSIKIISAPLYLASKTISCWKCKSDMPVVGLIAASIQEMEGNACILSYITNLPATVLNYIQEQFPSFKLTFSKTTEFEYYANTCPNCGILYGDFFLHSEVGAPFFPQSEVEAACLIVEEVPMDSPIEVNVEGLRIGGSGDFILKHGKRKV